MVRLIFFTLKCLLAFFVVPMFEASPFQQDRDEVAAKNKARLEFLHREQIYFKITETNDSNGSSYKIDLVAGRETFELCDEEGASSFYKHLNNKAAVVVDKAIQRHSLTPSQGRKLMSAAQVQNARHCRELKALNRRISDSRSASQLGNYALRASRYSGVEFEDSLFYKVLTAMVGEDAE